MANAPALPPEPPTPPPPPPPAPPAPPPKRRARLEYVLPPLFAAVFFFQADGVANRRGLTDADVRLANTVRELNRSPDAPPVWHQVRAAMQTLTHLGDFEVLLGLSVLVTAVLAWRRQWRLALVWALTQTGSALTVEWLKAAFARVRPAWAVENALEQGSYSFPSGHAAGSAAFYGLLGYLLARLWPATWSRGAITAAATCIVLTVGYSRMYLGVHYLSDVLAGFCVGLTWVCAAVIVIEWKLPR
jgi:membrane-associated phospholipid phosphatase